MKIKWSSQHKVTLKRIHRICSAARINIRFFTKPYRATKESWCVVGKGKAKYKEFRSKRAKHLGNRDNIIQRMRNGELYTPLSEYEYKYLWICVDLFSPFAVVVLWWECQNVRPVFREVDPKRNLHSLKEISSNLTSLILSSLIILLQ